MTTNSPNQVDGDVQALIYRCKDAVAHLSQMVEAGIRGGRYSVTEYRYQLMINKIALAALEADAVGRVNRGDVSDSNEYPDAKVDCIHEQADWDNFQDGTLLYTTPPAQLLRPVELPDEKILYEINQSSEAWMIAKNLENAGWNECIAEVQRLNATAQPVSDGCKWSFDDDGYYWEAACGSSWVFNDGGPVENECNFCQKCGGKVMLAAAPGGQDD